MKTLTFKKEHHVGKLLKELLDLPSLKPITTEEGKQAVFTLKHNGNNIYLRVPDSAPENEIKTVIESHDPTPPPEPKPEPSEVDLLKERVKVLEDKLIEKELITREELKQEEKSK